MGAVYKARQTKLDRMVALKIIRPETTGDPAFAERFMREARTLARLNHSGIVAFHDFGEIDAPELFDAPPSTSFSGKLSYFNMEYVDGTNLRQLMEAGQLSPELAVSIVPQVCDALQYAHDEGVVGRDIKPESILLDSRGRVKIADFGLAKLAGRSVDAWTSTGTQQVMGTPRYMAPKQMAGSREVDHRADIYSLGVVFFEMLTGTVPVGHFAIPSHKSKIVSRLDDVVLKAMASEPERRFQAARDLRSSVEQISSPSIPSDLNRSREDGHSQAVGFSTINDREVLGAWKMVAGHSTPTQEMTAVVPVLLFLTLCILGASGTLLPWFEVELASASLYQSHGLDLRLEIATAIGFGCIALFWLIVPQQHRFSLPVTLTGIALSFLSLATMLLAPVEAQHASFDLRSASAAANAADGPEVPVAETALVAPVYPSQYVYGYRSRVTLKPGYFSLGMTMVLLVLSGAGFRRSNSGPDCLLEDSTIPVESHHR